MGGFAAMATGQPRGGALVFSKTLGWRDGSWVELGAAFLSVGSWGVSHPQAHPAICGGGSTGVRVVPGEPTASQL